MQCTAGNYSCWQAHPSRSLRVGAEMESWLSATLRGLRTSSARAFSSLDTLHIFWLAGGASRALDPTRAAVFGVGQEVSAVPPGGAGAHFVRCMGQWGANVHTCSQMAEVGHAYGSGALAGASCGWQVGSTGGVGDSGAGHHSCIKRLTCCGVEGALIVAHTGIPAVFRTHCGQADGPSWALDATTSAGKRSGLSEGWAGGRAGARRRCQDKLTSHSCSRHSEGRHSTTYWEGEGRG